MKTVTELREQLSQVFNELRNNTIKHTDAAELANIAGKMINSAKVQLEYYALRKESPTISFLASEEAPLVKETRKKKV
jgi:5-formyltetrahydrofolate cyclo-ligase